MTEHLTWGYPVIAYLFLAGLGAGAGTVGASMLLRGGNIADSHRAGEGLARFDIARHGAFVAPVAVIVGVLLLILELGSFEAGNYLRFLNLFTTINLSPMSLGSWLLISFILTSLLYAYTFLSPDCRPDDGNAKLRNALAWILVPLGIGVAVYTGILLGAMPSRPFWNSPILAMLFLLSALSTGVAIIILSKSLLQSAGGEDDAADYLLTATDIMFIGFEVLVVFLFIMYAHLTVGNVKSAVGVVMGGDLTTYFWIGVVLVGLILPALVEMKYVVPTLIHQRRYTIPRNVKVLVSVVVLLGGFMLRYVIVVAGQVTGANGI